MTPSIPEDGGHPKTALVKLYREALTVAPSETKRKVAARYVSVLKNADADTVSFYESVLFRATDLEYFTEEGRRLALAHLFDSIQHKCSDALLECCNGIADQLKVEAEISKMAALLCWHGFFNADESKRLMSQNMLVAEMNSTASSAFRRCVVAMLSKIATTVPAKDPDVTAFQALLKPSLISRA